MANQQEPVFVNLQSGNVRVYDENRHRICVVPWSKRNRGQDGLFEVKGEHYRQFVSPKGPLFPRPAGAESAAPAPGEDDAASKTKVTGGKTSPADGRGKKKEDPQEPEVPKDLSEYTVEGAAEWIAATEDTVLLLAWAEADDRKGIKEAVEKRLVELEE